MAFRLYRALISGVAAVAGLAAFSGVQAAPQALALLETGGPMPLVCADGVCKAEFTTYCLQKERPLPGAGTPYEVAQGDALRLLLTGSNGTVRRVEAGPHVRIRTSRAGHTAVVVEMPAGVLAQFDARTVAVEVGEGVTLAPVAVADDDNPLTEQELRLAAGPLRALGARGCRSCRWVGRHRAGSQPPGQRDAGGDRDRPRGADAPVAAGAPPPGSMRCLQKPAHRRRGNTQRVGATGWSNWALCRCANASAVGTTGSCGTTASAIGARLAQAVKPRLQYCEVIDAGPPTPNGGSVYSRDLR